MLLEKQHSATSISALKRFGIVFFIIIIIIIVIIILYLVKIPQYV